jgi:hypothetical protein
MRHRPRHLVGADSGHEEGLVRTAVEGRVGRPADEVFARDLEELLGPVEAFLRQLASSLRTDRVPLDGDGRRRER